jgi:hypothetical protein
VWWLAVAGRIDNRVGRLAPHAKALACWCCLGLRGGDGVWRWWLRLALVMVVGWRSLARWAAALARGRRLAALGFAQPHAPPARLRSVQKK